MKAIAHPGGSVEYAFPTTVAQQAFWFLDRLEPGNPAYNIAVRFRLTGPLDVSILHQAINNLLERHEILRTTFQVLDSEPVQIVHGQMQVDLPIEDLRSFPVDVREAEEEKSTVAEARRRFDLTKGPLFRARLLRLNSEEHMLLVTTHHIISDGWSVGIISDEIAAFYEAIATGRAVAIEKLPFQFADFAVWSEKRRKSADLSSDREFWREKLSNLPSCELPTDKERPVAKTNNGDITSFVLARPLTDRLIEIAHKQNCTFYVLALSAVQAMIRLYTNRDDIYVGTLLAGRERVELERLIGLFVNTIVLRNDLSGNPEFCELMRRSRQTLNEGMAHSQLHFAEIVEAVRPKRDASRPTLYCINFIYQRDFVRPVDFCGIKLVPIFSRSPGAIYDLNFFMVERGDGWRLSCEYNIDLYEQATVQRFLSSVSKIFETVAQNPNVRLSELAPIVTSSQRGTSIGVAVPHAYATAPAPDQISVKPASLIQQRFWRLCQLDPGTASLSTTACVRVAGPLSAETLQKSFTFLFGRHETIRTTFEERNEEIVQIISLPSDFSLPVSDLSGLPSKERDSRLQHLIRMEASLPFNLRKGPLVRIRLYRLTDQDHVLGTVTHHIIADGWSNSVLQNDLWSAYSGYAQERKPALNPLEVQYSDFVTRQNEWLQSPEAKQQLDFWTKWLSRDLSIVDFPTDRPPSTKPASHGAVETLMLPDDLVSELTNTGRSLNVTPFTVLLAAFGVLLASSSGQDKVIVGSPFANRRAETESLVGPLANPLCLKLDFSGDPTLQDVLLHTQSVTVAALNHTELPFELLLDHLRMRGAHGRRPLFQFYFFHHPAFLQHRRVEKLEVSPLPTFSSGTSFEMQLGIIERPDGTSAELEYNPDLFDASTIRALLTRFLTVLDAMTSGRSRRFSEVPQLQAK